LSKSNEKYSILRIFGEKLMNLLMKYKILVLDLDGTLTNNKKEITEHTLRTLIDAQERGVKIVLASGRPTYGIVPIAEKLELKKYGGYILSYNGGEITNWQTGELMYENVLDADVLPYLYRIRRSARAKKRTKCQGHPHPDGDPKL
jgi:HAD superfamily hydrolase (TIGR01484 family)